MIEIAIMGYGVVGSGVAEVLAKCIPRTDDFVARYGGEEFVVVLPNTNEIGARIVAERIMEQMQANNIPHASSDIARYITFSIGFATGVAKHTNTVNDFIQKADEMLYKAKKSGRNRYEYQSM